MTMTPQERGKLGGRPKKRDPEGVEASTPVHGYCVGVTYTNGTVAPVLTRCQKAALSPRGFCEGHAKVPHQQRLLLALVNTLGSSWEQQFRDACRADGVSIAREVPRRPEVPLAPTPPPPTPPRPTPTPAAPAAVTEAPRATRFTLPADVPSWRRPS